jgi:hypothetical protein
MKISILFGLRKESYVGEYGPEVLAARDEFSIDESPEGWHDAIEATKKTVATEMQAMSVIDMVVDDSVIRAILLPRPRSIHGAIVPREEEKP